MTMKLVQKHLVKGTREFELVDDGVFVSIDMPFLKKDFLVVFSILEPEPVIQGSTLSFVSAVNREALIELMVDKPDPKTFNEFVDVIKQRVIEEEFGKVSLASVKRTVDVKQVQETLDMLRTYLDGDGYQPLLDALEALKAEPENEDRLAELFRIFNGLGPLQGAVLSYAPYISTLFMGEMPDFGPDS